MYMEGMDPWERFNNDFNKAKFESKGTLALIMLALLYIAVVAGTIGLFVGIEVWLWNTIVAGVLGAAKLSFWQMLGLDILSSMLFGRISVNRNKSNN